MNLFFIFIFSLVYMFLAADKMFLSDSNYGNLANWKENHLPCDKSHVIFGDRAPKVFINGTTEVQRIFEMILPMDGELIFDDAMTITTSDVTETSNCNIIEAHYDKNQPDFWYDPKNWCQTKTPTSPCQRKPNVEASMVPSSLDRVVFRQGYSFYVGVKSAEPKVVVTDITLRGVRYRNTFTFRQKIGRTQKSKAMEFVKVDSKYAPIIDINGGKCAGGSCILNSNLERMAYICAYVTCRALSCKTRVKPTGGCCRLCGQIFRVKINKFSSSSSFIIWFEDVMESNYKASLIFNVLAVETFGLEIVLSSSEIDTDVTDSLATEVVRKILKEKVMIGVASVEGMTWNMAAQSTSSYGQALVTCVIILVVLLVLVVVFALRRRIPLLSTITETVSIHVPNLHNFRLPAMNLYFLRGKFPRSRLHEDDEDVTVPSSLFPSISGAAEVIELPEKVTDVSFDNPIFDSEMAYEDSLQ